MQRNRPEPYAKLADEILAMASTFKDMFQDDAELADFLVWLVEHADKGSLAGRIASCGFALGLSLLAIGGAAGLVVRWVLGA